MPSPLSSIHEPTGIDVIGWDVGGVNLKAAAIAGGKVVAAAEAPYQIRRGLGVIGEALAAMPDWARQPAHHAVTMTAELSAVFDDRRAGVAALCGWARDHLAGPIEVYAGRDGFVAIDAAPARALAVASANWHATAAFLASKTPDALLVDIGSTTTDLILVEDGSVAALGSTDAERLAFGELVYCGAIRTPLMALAERLPFAGFETRLVAEQFCTIADIHRLTGDLPDGIDRHDTADGRDKSLAASRARLARLIGHDAADAPDHAWDDLASFLAEVQLRRLHDAAARILSRRVAAPRPLLVGCGLGRFLARRLAERMSLPYRDLAEFVPLGGDCGDWASTCAPAVAVACLAAGL